MSNINNIFRSLLAETNNSSEAKPKHISNFLLITSIKLA